MLIAVLVKLLNFGKNKLRNTKWEKKLDATRKSGKAV